MNDKLMRKECHDCQEYYCPTGFVFLTNMGIGIRSWGVDETELYAKTINALQRHGYIIQVAEPFTIYNKSFSQPMYLHLAIYIKNEDGKPVNLSHAHDVSYQSIIY